MSYRPRHLRKSLTYQGKHREPQGVDVLFEMFNVQNSTDKTDIGYLGDRLDNGLTDASSV
jgi:hypothetical protein